MITVFIEPWDDILLKDDLFNISSRPINRDEVLRPWAYLREACAQKDILLKTIDRFDDFSVDNGGPFYFCCFEKMDRFQAIRSRFKEPIAALYLFEPPIGTKPITIDHYHNLPYLNKIFRSVYATSTIEAVNKSYNINSMGQLKQFFYPQALDSVIEPLWSRKKDKFMVMINTYHYSPLSGSEYYSKRVSALAYFSRFGLVDLYGRRWEQIFNKDFKTVIIELLRAAKHLDIKATRENFMLVKNRRAISSIWRGSCINKKYETLASYKFSLCFESMGIEGFISEKIFDCLLVGTIPVYLGAPDISEWVPPECFIDVREFDNYKDLHKKLELFSDKDCWRMRNAGRDFIESEKFRPFTKEYFTEQFISGIKADLCLGNT